MKLPTDQTGNRTRSVVPDERGTRIAAVVRGVVYSAPHPLSDDAAPAYLRLLLDTHGGQA